jgi:hypothetical protein
VHQFGHDAHRDLLATLRADIDTDGGMHAIQVGGGEPFFPERTEELFPLAPAADHPDIARLGAQDLHQDRPVVQMAAGEDDDVPAAAYLKPLQGAVEFGDHPDVVRTGKAIGVGEFRPIIHHAHPEADHLGQPGRGLRDMSSPEHEHGFGR